MRGPVAICFITFFIWKSPTGQSFACDDVKTKRGHVVVCASPLKHSTKDNVR